MALFIQIKDGQTVNHPAFDTNLIQAFGEIPSNWELFVRVERPIPTAYQILEHEEASYQKVDGKWTDVWALREMTEEEKVAKQQAAKDAWSSQPNAGNFATWVFDEVTCTYVPPTPCPLLGSYFWQGSTNSWVLIPQKPNDGKRYRLDYVSAAWVEIL